MLRHSTSLPSFSPFFYGICVKAQHLCFCPRFWFPHCLSFLPSVLRHSGALLSWVWPGPCMTASLTFLMSSPITSTICWLWTFRKKRLNLIKMKMKGNGGKLNGAVVRDGLSLRLPRPSENLWPKGWPLTRLLLAWMSTLPFSKIYLSCNSNPRVRMALMNSGRASSWNGNVLTCMQGLADIHRYSTNSRARTQLPPTFGSRKIGW